MDPVSVDRRRETKRIFGEVFALPAARRDERLEQECAGDHALRRCIELMIAAAEGAVGRADPGCAPGAEVENEGPGTRLGPYQLIERLGEGGFGVVFLAEQENPVRRQVALKIIKLGMDTREVVARFEQERQALALMDHPNITKVLDVGATAGGRPYFVMELVRGVPLTEYCDRNALSTDERLRLLIPVCHALQHAHQKGIIHRDVKPSNILVSLQEGRPVPKVIDFGVAKATSGRLTRRALHTEQGQILGTPTYMSPEQLQLGALDVDTRSDVYGLGVVLYELLTGTTPFKLEELLEAGQSEMQRLLLEVDPPRPSARLRALGDELARIAARRGTVARRLDARVRGDLDWIVMKALEKDRTRRYDSPQALAADIERHLTGQPVEAAPPSRTYRFKKFVRRRSGLVAAIGAVLFALVAGIVGTTVGLFRARAAVRSEHQARAAEERERGRAQATTDFLHGMLASVDPQRAAGREVTVKEVLDDAAARLATTFARDPEIEGALRHTLGESYGQLARYREAREQFVREFDLRMRTLGPADRSTLAAQYGSGMAALQLGELEEATRTLEQALATQERAFGVEDPDTLLTRSGMGLALQLSGDGEGALEHYRAALAGQVRVLGPGHEAVLETMGSIADVLQDLGRLQEAEAAARELVAAANAVEGEDGGQRLVGLSILASVLNDLGRYVEAEEEGRRAFDAKKRVYGMDHDTTIVTATVLATSLQCLDRFDEAVALLRDAAESSARALGSEHGTTLTILNNLARNEQLRGNLDEAERLFRRVLEARRRVSGENASTTLAVMNNLGLLLLARGDLAGAEAILRPMVAGIDATLPEGHWMRGQARVNLGRCLAAQGKHTEAEELLRTGFEAISGALPGDHDRLQRACEAIADLYRAMGKPDEEALWRARRVEQ